MRRNKETAYDRSFRAMTGRTPDVLYRGTDAKVQEIMKARHTDEAGVAEEVGVSRGTLRRWLTGRSTPSKANAAKLDSALRESLVDRKQAARTRGGRTTRVTVTGQVKIGQFEQPRHRQFTVENVPPELADKLAKAVASGDSERVSQALGSIIGSYTGQSEDYPVEVSTLGSLDIGSSAAA